VKKLTDEQRIARALRVAELEESRPALPSRLHSIRKRTLAERAKLYGRKLYGPRKRKQTAATKREQIERAVEMLMQEWTTRRSDPLFSKKPRGDQVVARLRSNAIKYFLSGIPYESHSKFEREVRLALARRKQQSL